MTLSDRFRRNLRKYCEENAIAVTKISLTQKYRNYLYNDGSLYLSTVERICEELNLDPLAMLEEWDEEAKEAK